MKISILVFILNIFVFALVHAQLYVGVNLSGAEFGTNVPGTYSADYIYPYQSEVNYFQDKGMNTIRLPFLWERLQLSLDGDFDTNELNRLMTFVSNATSNGVMVILDPHDGGGYYGNKIGSAEVPVSAFSNFWGRLALDFQTNNRVIFGLMNEPNTMPTDQWIAAANAAIAAIRSTGATNLILVPGNRWTGAWSWFTNNDVVNGINQGRANADAMLDIVDPDTNYLIEFHQYLDYDSSGTHDMVVSATTGVEDLTNATMWLQTHHLKGFLAEYAAPNDLINTNGNLGGQALEYMLSYIATNSVWAGWTWWSAGPWWGNYMFTLEPENLGQANQTDMPAMSVIKNFVPIPTPTLRLMPSRQIQFQSQPGFVYQIQSSTNLISGTWENSGSVTNGSGKIINFDINPNKTSFYRAEVNRTP